MNTAEFPEELLDKARGIALLALDVDGVLTDGKLHFGNAGEELKGFSILDGLGIKLLQNQGVEVAIITGRQSQLVTRRATDLGIKYIMQGREDKLTALDELLQQLELTRDQAAYVGDDLPDLSAICHARLGIAVANAYPPLKQQADWVTGNAGGCGAVREVCDLLLIANGKYSQAIDAFR